MNARQLIVLAGLAIVSVVATAAVMKTGATTVALSRQQAACLRLIDQYFPTGTRVTRPEGGYFLWLALPEGVDSLALHLQSSFDSLSQGIAVFDSDRRLVHRNDRFIQLLDLPPSLQAHGTGYQSLGHYLSSEDRPPFFETEEQMAAEIPGMLEELAGYWDCTAAEVNATV